MIMRYTKQAQGDFEKALVKYKSFVEGELKPLKLSIENAARTNDRIDKFIDSLGFDMYCEEYIFCMADYVGKTINKDKEHANDYLQLLVLITSGYAKEHADCISDDFKEMAIAVLKTYELNALLDIVGDIF